MNMNALVRRTTTVLATGAALLVVAPGAAVAHECMVSNSVAHDLPELSAGVIADFAAHVRNMEGAFTVAYLEPKGGAASRVEESTTAMGGRQASYGFHALAGWPDPADDGPVMAWARSFGAAMSAHATGGVYLNLIAEDESDRIPAAISDYDRLQRLKRSWDGKNLLRGNHNIVP